MDFDDVRRRKIFWHDLPITKGLHGFIAEAGVPGPLDEAVRTGALS